MSYDALKEFVIEHPWALPMAIMTTCFQFFVCGVAFAVWVLFFDGWEWIKVNVLDEEPTATTNNLTAARSRAAAEMNLEFLRRKTPSRPTASPQPVIDDSMGVVGFEAGLPPISEKQD